MGLYETDFSLVLLFFSLTLHYQNWYSVTTDLRYTKKINNYMYIILSMFTSLYFT